MSLVGRRASQLLASLLTQPRRCFPSSYITFILSEIPAAIIVRRYGYVWIPVSVVVFGILTLGTAFIHNRGAFFAMRSLLGVAESLVFPGNAYMLTRVSSSHVKAQPSIRRWLSFDGAL